MEVRQRNFINLSGLNSNFIANIFHDSPHSTHKKYNSYVHNRNTSKYGNKSLRVLGVHIWNPLTDNIKYETSMNIFKGYIKTWFGPKCKCYLFAN